MRHLIRFVVLALICLVAVGLYRGWFSFSGNKDAGGDKVNMGVSVDVKKMEGDLKKAEKGITGGGSQNKHRDNDGTTTGPPR